MFEFETKMWSQITMNLPLNRAYYQFHLDDDAIMNIVAYARIDNTLDLPLQMRCTSFKIPLKNPEKLIHLCWFQIRDCGFASKNNFLKNWIC